MKQMLSVGILVLAASALSAQSAAAAISTFLIIPGISGDSTYQGYEGAIDVYSVTQSFTAGGKTSTACTVVVGKGLDRSGPLLWAAAATGQSVSDVRIDIVKDGATPLRFYSLTLTNAYVVVITSSPNALTESVTLSGSSATLSYYPQKPDGTLGAAITSTVSCK